MRIGRRRPVSGRVGSASYRWRASKLPHEFQDHLACGQLDVDNESRKNRNGSLTEGNTKGSEAGNLEGRIKGITGRALFVGSLQLVLILLPRPLLSAVQLRMFSCHHLSRRLRTQQVSFGYNRNAFRASCNLDFLGMPENIASFVEGRRNWGGMLS